MAGKQTQPKPGHLRGTSRNSTDRTGRSDGHEQIQGGVPGHRHGSSHADEKRGGSDPVQGDVRGYTGKVSSRGVSTKRVGLVNRKSRISK